MQARNKRDIVLYAGPGASLGDLPQALLTEIDYRHHSLRLTGPESLSNDPGCLDDAVAFFMPGGADLPYCSALDGSGNAAIRRFVEAGGTYFGICAGAYYACRRIAFHEGRADEITGPRELAFFPGTAEGSLPELGSFYDATRRSASIVDLVGLNGTAFASYYNGGPRFVADENEQDFQVLAQYGDNGGQAPGIVSLQVGEGRAILSGVHIEVSAAALDAGLRYERAERPDLLASLRRHEPPRRAFWRSLLVQAGIRLQ